MGPIHAGLSQLSSLQQEGTSPSGKGMVQVPTVQQKPAWENEDLGVLEWKPGCVHSKEEQAYKQVKALPTGKHSLQDTDVHFSPQLAIMTPQKQ